MSSRHVPPLRPSKSDKFCHTFEDACRNSGISTSVMNALQGHKESGMSVRYGQGFTLSVLSDAMGELRYPELDLSHLFVLD